MTPEDRRGAERMLAEMAEILRAAQAGRPWAARLESLAAAGWQDGDGFRHDVRRLYGGMGSLNDVIPQDPDGRVDRDAAGRFDSLRQALYALVCAPGARPDA